jgi:hypothetical protein
MRCRRVSKSFGVGVRRDLVRFWTEWTQWTKEGTKNTKYGPKKFVTFKNLWPLWFVVVFVSCFGYNETRRRHRNHNEAFHAAGVCQQLR